MARSSPSEREPGRPAGRAVPPIAVAAIAWLVPGAGHALLGRYVRGASFFVAIVLTFAIGLGVSRGHAVSAPPSVVVAAVLVLAAAGHLLVAERGRWASALALAAGAYLAVRRLSADGGDDHPLASLAQVGAGLPALIPLALGWLAAAGEALAAAPARLPDAIAGTIDLGHLYTMVAGLLNLLVVHDAYERAAGLRPERLDDGPPSEPSAGGAARPGSAPS